MHGSAISTCLDAINLNQHLPWVGGVAPAPGGAAVFATAGCRGLGGIGAGRRVAQQAAPLLPGLDHRGSSPRARRPCAAWERQDGGPQSGLEVAGGVRSIPRAAPRMVTPRAPRAEGPGHGGRCSTPARLVAVAVRWHCRSTHPARRTVHRVPALCVATRMCAGCAVVRHRAALATLQAALLIGPAARCCGRADLDCIAPVPSRLPGRGRCPGANVSAHNTDAQMLPSLGTSGNADRVGAVRTI